MQTASNTTTPGALPATQLQSIKNPKWLSLIRRMQQMACTQQGLAAITVTVFVDCDANPIQWTSPRMVCLEPKDSGGELLDFLAGL